MQSVQAEYGQKFAAQQQAVEQRANQIKQDTPDPSSTEVLVNGTIEFRSKLREFSFDVPQVTMVTKKMAMDLPQVESKVQDYSMNVPVVRMELQCVAGPPVVVVEWKMCQVGFAKFKCNPSTTVKPGKEVCTHVPKTYSERRDVRFNVPQVKMARTDWSMSVPQVKMATQSLKFNVPEIVLKDVQGELRDTQREAQKLGVQAEKDANALGMAMNNEIKSASSEMISGAFACRATELDSAIKKATDEIEVHEAGIVASLNQARSVGATEIAKKYESTLKELSGMKAKLAKDHTEARKSMADEEKAALAQVTVNAGGAVIATGPEVPATGIGGSN
ncbi:hypothetical protein LO55_229 [Massilia timonae]|uniref:Uncharacterized protein n=2 Tax=Massilia timonae TaxID=47229 RepID=A0A1S2NFF6_9BURK|nr:hypothetical protein LO55_229 [Massilia timonae]